MPKDTFVSIMIAVGFLVILLSRGIFHYREYDRRRPQCSEGFDGARCLKKAQHVSEHHAFQEGVPETDRGIRWTTEYAKRKG